MRATSSGDSATWSAPSDSVSCVRLRAPISGTMFGPLANTHAIASCGTVASFSAAI